MLLKSLKYCVVAVCLVACTELVSGQYELHNYTISGRVVDKDRKPVAFAQIALLPKPMVMRKSTSPDLLIGIITADQNGKFRGEERTPEQLVDQVLYIAPPTSPNTFAPISFPVDYVSKFEHSFSGYPIRRIKDQELDVGDKVLLFQYGVAYVKLVDKNGNPLFRDAQDWEGVGLRITDSKGKRIAEHFLQSHIAKVAVDLNESTIALSLPEGLWHVEVAPDGDSGKWVKSTKLLVSKSKSPLKVIIRVSVRH